MFLNSKLFENINFCPFSFTSNYQLQSSFLQSFNPQFSSSNSSNLHLISSLIHPPKHPIIQSSTIYFQSSNTIPMPHLQLLLSNSLIRQSPNLPPISNHHFQPLITNPLILNSLSSIFIIHFYNPLPNPSPPNPKSFKF